MEVINIKKLKTIFDLSVDDIQKVLLRHSNKISVKLMNEVPGDGVYVPKNYFYNIKDAISLINESLTPLADIKKNKTGVIKIKKSNWIYYLFYKGDVVYIGQSMAVLNRIHSHQEDGKIFDSVYVEEVDKSVMLLKEKFYIHRDYPKLNIAIMTNQEYMKEILLLTETPEDLT